MRKLVVSSFVSLDGVVESPQDWALAHWTPENQKHTLAKLADYDAFLFGRKTYEMFVGIFPGRTGDPYYDTVNRMPKYVASTTLRETTWNATRIQGDLATEVAKLKEQRGKDIMKYGNSQLDRTLLAHNLIDAFDLIIFPFAVGKGRRLFEGIEGGGPKLELTGTTKLENGIISLSYKVRR